MLREELGQVNMAHFCEIRTDNNEVLRTVVKNNSDINANGGDLSAEAETWVANNTPPDPIIKEELGGVYPDTYWKQTSYNTSVDKYWNQDGSEGDQSKAFRGTYAGPGHTYDPSIDKFIPHKPHDNWVWDETVWRWNPPVAVPTDENGPYEWDQENNQWVSTKGI
tara:strand:+ start:243 stop:737 length:495 start_codon:yes stop_codon:yes gene_type:complete